MHSDLKVEKKQSGQFAA